MTDDAIRRLIISHHLLDTNEIILIPHARCGMLGFTDFLLKAGLEGDPAAEKLLQQATARAFMSCKAHAPTSAQLHAFRGPLEPLDAARRRSRSSASKGAARRARDPQPPVDPDQRAGRGHRAQVHLRRGHRQAGRSGLSGADGIDRLGRGHGATAGAAPPP